jgi:hypothetical protein
MKIQYKDYTIEIINDTCYTLNSTDNTRHYDKEYFKGKMNEDRFYPTSKHGIRISQNGKEISSAIICEVGGATGIHDKSFAFTDDSILVCCCDKIYCLQLPRLSLNWRKRFDAATCFGIYDFDGDFLIHGELSVTRIDKDGNEKWNFIGRDILVTNDNTSAFEIYGDKIKLKDWEGYKYMLDKNGLVLESGY